jgi:hypothetical protein
MPEFQFGTSTKTNGEYSLQIELVNGESDDYTLELYDFNTGKIVATERKYFVAGDNKIVFEKVKSSTYTVYFSSVNCPKKKAFKGLGIVLH